MGRIEKNAVRGNITASNFLSIKTESRSIEARRVDEGDWSEREVDQLREVDQEKNELS